MKQRTVTKVYDGWAHVEPSSFTVGDSYDTPPARVYGVPEVTQYVGSMYRHDTVNGGEHCVWRWANGEAFEFWRAANGAVVGGPKAL